MSARRAPDDSIALHDRIARARRSIVAIRAGARIAPGWVALGNGVIVTSRSAIGYPAEVSIEPEEGLARAGRVIAVHMGHDIALLLPLEAIPSQPLPLRMHPEPRLGEPALALSCLPRQGTRLADGRVSHVQRGDDHLPQFEISAAAPLGAPVLDSAGRLLGVAASPAAGEEDDSDDPRGRERSYVALAAAALQPLLAQVDRPAAELRDRTPVYRCPRCDEPFDIELDRCSSCGRALPHAYPGSVTRAGAERLVREALSTIGVAANRVRFDACTWRLAQRAFSTSEATLVEIQIDERGEHLTVRAPVVALPAANHEPFYRFLLTMNDQTTGEMRVSVAGDLVSVSCVEALGMARDTTGASTEALSAGEIAVLIDEVVRIADEYRRTLAETFDAVPRFDEAAR